MTDKVSSEGVFEFDVETWPLALTLLRRDESQVGGWVVMAVNKLCREELGWSAGGHRTVFDWLRALGEGNALRCWLNEPTMAYFKTAQRHFRRLDLADQQVGIVLERISEEPSWCEVLELGRALPHSALSGTLLTCRSDGSVVSILPAAGVDPTESSAEFLDQILPVQYVDQAYTALAALADDPSYQSTDLTATRLKSNLALLAINHGTRAETPAPETIWTCIVKGIEGVFLALSSDGRVIASSEDAEQFWSANLIGRLADELLVPQQNGTVTFWASTTEKSARETNNAKIWARFEADHRTRVRLYRRDVQFGTETIVLLRIESMEEKRGAEQTIHNLAHFDPLTGLPNRQLFADRMANAIEHAKRYHQIITIMVVDVDRFKLINDSLGLDMGDVAIKAITQRIISVLDEGDTIARSGADEFLLMGFQPTNAEDAARLAKVIHAAFRAPVVIGPHDISVSVSIGIALFPHDGDQPADLLRNADAALGRAKAQGRNISQFFTDDMNATAFERLMLENRLRKALQNKEMRVYYQPQVQVNTGSIVGVEALIRWFHPELGVISPAEFIPLAEETGLILPIGLWALEEACRQVRVWQNSGHAQLRLAVNLSALQFEQEDLVGQMQRVLATTGMPASCLELELTESVVMRNAEETVHRLKKMRDLGVSLAVDDFGTGYSSLAYLKRFPLRSLKIDRSFVGDIDRDANSLAIVQAIIAMGNALGIKLVAEGVETNEQLEKLRHQGCEEMQGFLFSRPLPADELGKMLTNHSRLKLAT